LITELLRSLTPVARCFECVKSSLNVFGCLCYPLIPSVTRNKLQLRSTPCVFLSYPSNHRGYKCYELPSCKIIFCRHVIVYENTFPFSTLSAPPTSNYDFLDTSETHFLHTNPSIPPSSKKCLENSRTNETSAVNGLWFKK
jgi:hypothetical protein